MQTRHRLTLDDLPLGDLIEPPLGQPAVLAEDLDVEQTTVGGKAYGP